jgi:hypothetical protein
MGRAKLCWDCIMLLLIFWQLNTLTLMVAFDITPIESYSFGLESLQNQESFIGFQIISSVFIIIDILIKFNTGSFEGGSEIYDKSTIVKKYLKTSFIFDFLGLVPHLIFFGRKHMLEKSDYIKYFWLFLFKLHPLSKFLDNIKEGLLRFEGKKEAIYLLIRLLAEVFIVCHLFACIWHYTALRSNYKSWIQFLNLQEVGWEDRYMKAIYYVVVTMTTTGYGDITPQSRSETLVSIFCMFLGSFLVGYSINSIGEILESAKLESKVSR